MCRVAGVRPQGVGPPDRIDERSAAGCLADRPSASASEQTPSERGCELTYVNTAGRRPQTREHAALVGGGRVPTAEETEQLAAEQGSI